MVKHNSQTRLFVYGTLAPGRENHGVVDSISGHWEPATLRGELFQEGWGSAAGFPGILPSNDAEEVPGFVLTSSDLPAHWSRLDAFEGDGYRRESALVKLSDGTKVSATVYALNRNQEK